MVDFKAGYCDRKSYLKLNASLEQMPPKTKQNLNFAAEVEKMIFLSFHP